MTNGLACSSSGNSRVSIFLVGWGCLHSTGYTATCSDRKSLTPHGGTLNVAATTLLDNDLLLLRIHSALRRLCRHRNHGFSGGQRRREVMETAICVYHWHFAAIYHDPSPVLRLARHLDHVPMLYERIEFEFDGLGLLTLGNDGEAVFLALHRFFPCGVIRLHHPVIGAFAEAGDRYRCCINFLINECRRKIRVAGDAETVTNCIRHRRPGKCHVLGGLARGK